MIFKFLGFFLKNPVSSKLHSTCPEEPLSIFSWKVSQLTQPQLANHWRKEYTYWENDFPFVIYITTENKKHLKWRYKMRYVTLQLRIYSLMLFSYITTLCFLKPLLYIINLFKKHIVPNFAEKRFLCNLFFKWKISRRKMAFLFKHESASPMASVDQFCHFWFQRNQPQGEGSLANSNLARGRQDWTFSIRWIKTNSKDSGHRSAEIMNDVKNIFNIITRWTIETVRVKFFEFSKELIFVNQLSSLSQNFLT